MKFGIDQFKGFKNKKVSLITNESTFNSEFKSTVSIIHKTSKLISILSPQHGFNMEKQANMIESKDTVHSLYKIPIYSLYSKTRTPSKKMLSNVDVLVFDLQDIGTRFYTYIYTMANAMKMAKKEDKEFIVLDRPNPINGVNVEGRVVEKDYTSFVGMYPIPVRHGMTVGEIALFLNSEFNINCRLEIIKLKGWNRKKYLDTYTNLFFPPSPNIPSVKNCITYPGMCLLEATNISEGRGTVNPFLVFGAPYLNQEKFLKQKEIKALKGVKFLKTSFTPTFDKYKGKNCFGFYIHVTDRACFKPYKTGLAIIYVINKLFSKFSFNPPPYEYEYKKMPIDILTGSKFFRTNINKDFSFIYKYLSRIPKSFINKRKQYLIY
jgi:uncharacterized protein YbbC (DUF1343 family)